MKTIGARREKRMKQLMLGLVIAVFVMSFAACDQAQKALDTVDKAISIKDDVEKKAKEVTDKARNLIPGNNREGGKDQGEKDSEKDD
jgi:hypothetical protein